MNTRIVVTLASVLILSGFSAQAGFFPKEAHSLYREKFAEAEPGCYDSGDILFLVLGVSFGRDAEPEEREMAILEAQLDAVSKYVGSSKPEKIDTPFPAKLTALVAPKFETVPFSLSEVDSVDVEETPTPTGCRLVVALDAVPLRKAREMATAKRGEHVKYGLEAWRDGIRSVMDGLATQDESRTIRFLLGDIIADVSSVPGLCLGGKGSPDWESAARAVMECPSPTTVQEAAHILGVFPVWPSALNLLSEKARADIRPDRAIVFAIQSGLAGDPKAGWGLARDIAADADVMFENKAWSEWVRLHEAASDPDSFFASFKTPMWRRFSTIGGLISFTPEEIGGNDEFEQATLLFRQGKNVPRILELLASSLESGPYDYAKWVYLGRTLVIAHRPVDALLAFEQALRSGASADDIFSRILPLLEDNGFPALAAGVAWHVYIGGKIPAAENARLFLEKHFGDKLP